MPANDLELYGSFFMNDKEYYLKQLDKYRSGKKLDFNFSVIALGIVWFIYRKLYRESLIISLIIAASAGLNFLLIKPHFGGEGNIVFFLAFAFSLWTALGFIANKIYIKKAEWIVASAKNHFQDTAQITNEVSTKGGVNPFGLLIAIIIVFIVAWLTSK